MKLIVVTDKNWAIGKDNGLLVHLPGDLKYFKEKTLGKVLIMGRKTLESLPGSKPLKGRTTIVLTKNSNYMADFENSEDTRLFVATNFDEIMTKILAMEFTEGIDAEEDVFVAGGASIYEMFSPYCTEFYVTKIEAEFPADKYFQNLDKFVESGRLKLTWESEIKEEKGIRYKFTKYER